MNTFHSLIVLLLFLFLSKNVLSQTTSVADIEKKAINLVNNFLGGQKNTEKSAPTNVFSKIPIGLSRTINNITYTIVFDTVRLEKAGMLANAYMTVKFPGTAANDILTFVSRDITFTPEGVSNFKNLELLTNREIKLSNNLKLIVKGGENTYIKWDCNGFQEISMASTLKLDSSSFFQSNEKGKIINNNFEIDIRIQAYDLSNVSLSITTDKYFGVRYLDGFSFQITDAFLDYSTTANDSNFPKDYFKTNINDSTVKAWRGLFIKSLKVVLPSKLSQKDAPNTTLDATNLIIDNDGISGGFKGTNILTSEKGAASGWPFSINDLEVGLEKNTLIKAGFSGTIKVPALNDTLVYRASMAKNNNGQLDYFLSAKLTNDKIYKNFICNSTLTIGAGSHVDIADVNNEFTPSLYLNGKISLNEEKINVKDIAFVGLQISSKAPYISGGSFAVAGRIQFDLYGLSASISNINLNIDNGVAKLSFSPSVGLMGLDKGISGSASLTVESIVEQKSQEWKYNKTDISEISLNGSLSGFSFVGKIAVYKNDGIYGDGFMGKIKVKEESLTNYDFEAEARFGRVSNLNYWFTKIGVTTNIQIGGGFLITKIDGGLYWHMTKVDGTYKPSDKIGLGFLAGTDIEFQAKNIMNGHVGLGMEFNNSWGLNRIYFGGNAHIMASDTASSAVKVVLNCNYDFVNTAFHANLDATINAMDMIKGGGWAEIHADPKKWYIYIGTKQIPISLSLVGLAQASSYLNTGSVVNIGKNSFGKGFVFGLSLKSSGKFERACFYASYNVLLNTEFSIFQSSEKCGNELMGINGWRANSSLQLHFEGDVGIAWRSSKYSLLSLNGDLSVIASLPNPSFFEGKVDVSYSILGGFVSGSASLSVSVGSECTNKSVPLSNPLEGIKLISSISPKDQSSVDVFTGPSLTLNVPIGEFVDENQSGKIYYRIVKDYVRLLNNTNLVDVTEMWSTDNKLCNLKLKEALKANSDYKFAVKIHLEKLESGSWVVQKDGSGNELQETAIANFKTGAAPTTVVQSNVIFSYPANKQMNFHIKEKNTGSFEMNTPQTELFMNNNIPIPIKARFIGDGTNHETNITYLNGVVTFPIPTDLKNNTVYSLQLIKSQTSLSTNEIVVSATNSTVEKNVVSMKIANVNLTGTNTNGEAVIYEMKFRTSKYNTFAEKVVSFQSKLLNINKANADKITVLYGKVETDEMFDTYDININNTNALITLKAESNNWMINKINPLLYDSYKTGDQEIALTRPIVNNEVRPFSEVYYKMSSNQLTLDDKAPLGTLNPTPGTFYISYEVGQQAYLDYKDLLNKVAAKYPSSSDLLNVKKLLYTPFTDLTLGGDYPVLLKYNVKGSIANSTCKINLKH